MQWMRSSHGDRRINRSAYCSDLCVGVPLSCAAATATLAQRKWVPSEARENPPGGQQSLREGDIVKDHMGRQVNNHHASNSATSTIHISDLSTPPIIGAGAARGHRRL